MMLGDKAMLVLDGQRPLPRRLLSLGFTFRFPELDAALRDLLA
jgi:NAD dependent epimerase/dehydratase family enzyme